MSAEMLRKAAAGLRNEWADEDGAPRPMGSAWHRERDFHLAVADWLGDLANDVEAQAAEGYEIGPRHPALTVARAYLGEAS